MSWEKKIKQSMENNGKSWIEYTAEDHFPIENLPYGVFKRKSGGKASIGVRISNKVLDLRGASENGLFEDTHISEAFQKVLIPKI